MGVKRLPAVALAVAAGWGAGCESGQPRGDAAPELRPAVVFAVGDAEPNASAEALAARIAAARPDRVLYLGDVYPAGTRADFRRRFHPLYGRLGRTVAPTPGNHEWPNRRIGYERYWTRLRGSAPRWYAFRVGGWEVLSLNSEARHGPRSRQVRWLRRRLAQRRTTCRIAYWHRPRYSAGLHGDQRDVAPLWKALRGHAAAVIGGHDHNLQRFRPLEGIVQFVSGAGGRRRHAVDFARPGLAFAADGVAGALRLELRPGRADAEFLTARGRRLDRTSLRCRR